MNELYINYLEMRILQKYTFENMNELNKFDNLNEFI